MILASSRPIGGGVGYGETGGVTPDGHPPVVDTFGGSTLDSHWLGETWAFTPGGGVLSATSSNRTMWWDAPTDADCSAAINGVTSDGSGAHLRVWARSMSNTATLDTNIGTTYGAAFANDGSFAAIFKFIDGAVSPPGLNLIDETVGLPDPTGTTFDMWLRVTGSDPDPVTLELFIDGVLVLTVDDTSDKINGGGYCGIGSYGLLDMDNFALGGATVSGGGGGGTGGGGGPDPTVLDAFDDRTGAAGANWTGIESGDWAWIVNSGRLLANNYDRAIFWAASLGGANQIGKVTFEPNVSSGQEVGLILRATLDAFTSGTHGQYYLFWALQNGSSVGVDRCQMVSSTFTRTNIATATGISLGARPVLRALAGSGGALQLWINSTKLIDTTDGSPLASGNYAGLRAQSPVPFDDFGVVAI